MPRQDIPELNTQGLRQFALLLGGILAVVLGILLPWQWEWDLLPNWYWIGSGAVISAWGLIDADSMRGLYRAWMRTAMMVGSLVNTIVLAVVFYFLITPMGLVRRMMGKDPMRRKLDANARSYRVKSKVAEREHMERPY